MRRSLALSACLLLAAASADAATRIVVRGGGFGHGIGLSQYGAFGYAQHGFGYREILARYYRGTELSRAPSRTVKVLLQWSDPYVRFRGATRIGSRRARPEATYVVRWRAGALSVSPASGRSVGRFPAPLKVSTSQGRMRLLGPAINGVTHGLYRGAFLLTPGSRGGVTAVNSIGLEPYLQGVVPGEMPSSWLPEALKAQAVVARSYALATLKPGAVFDLYPDTRSQVYRGVIAERPSTNAAVSATSGEVLTYGGSVAVTYYFSTSGGETENVENVFLGSLPRFWLRGVEDPFDNISPRHRWRFTFTPRQLQAKLRGYVLGRFKRVKVLRRGVSPRIVRARVDGSRGSRPITGPALRARLGLYDTWASFTRVSISRARSLASLASLIGLRLERPLLQGVFEPAPRGRRLALERRVRGRWKRVRTLRTSRGGRYRARVSRSGVYRVRAGSVAGPALRVRW